jgi:hypothetical protein
MFKKIFLVILPVMAASLIVGCSNQTIVSVADNAAPATASLTSFKFRDIGSSSTYDPARDVLWGLSNYQVPGLPDYYIYYFNPNTHCWVQTTNYGLKISATGDGKCYHINSNNNIWWCKMDTNMTTWTNGQITNPPQSGTMTDISAGTITGGGHCIWVAISGDPDYYVFMYETQGPDPGWNDKSPSGVGIINALSTEESGGTIVKTVGSAGMLYYNGSQWSTISTSLCPTNVTDVAMVGCWTLYPLNGQLKKISGTTSTLVSTGVRDFGVTGNEYHYYYLSSDQYVHVDTNTWN